MAKNDQRVNMRLDTETYEAYEKVAEFFNRTTVDMMREALQTGVPVMQMLGTIIDRAKAGDAEAMQELFDKFWQMQRGQLDFAEVSTAATMAEVHAAAKKSGQD